VPEVKRMSEASKAYPSPSSFVGSDGETYVIKPLSINGLVKIEEFYGFESVQEAFELRQLELRKAINLRFMLATVLQETYPDMTEEQAGNIVTLKNLNEAQMAIVWAFTQGLPGDEDEDADGEGDEETPADPSLEQEPEELPEEDT
jgi:hypothetical protein